MLAEPPPLDAAEILRDRLTWRARDLRRFAADEEAAPSQQTPQQMRVLLLVIARAALEAHAAGCAEAALHLRETAGFLCGRLNRHVDGGGFEALTPAMLRTVAIALHDAARAIPREPS
jgi:hypothetical protein